MILTCNFSFSQYSTLHDFGSGWDGSHPMGDLLYDGTYLYGMTHYGGVNDKGIIFKIMPDGTNYQKIWDFDYAPTGSYPDGSLITDGTFLYGVTVRGGGSDNGVIFKIMPDGSNYTNIFSFSGGSGTGDEPIGDLLYDGTFLYGTTSMGGTGNGGTIFKILTDGTGYEKLYDFNGSNDGLFPRAALISDGTFLYGMTELGGSYSSGTIFKIKTDGTGYQKLFDFDGSNNGYRPQGSLVTDGTNLFGMTPSTGVNDLSGTIFKLLTDGTGYEKLFEFDAPSQVGNMTGSHPLGSLLYDGTYLYGMTINGGEISSDGTIFRILPDGTDFTKLWDFSGGFTEGSDPSGSLITDGYFLYGMTYWDGNHNEGVVFKLDETAAQTESTSEFLISTYPNPTQDEVTLSVGAELVGTRFTITDNVGRIVLEETFKATEHKVNLSAFENGVYLIRTDNESQPFKILKQ